MIYFVIVEARLACLPEYRPDNFTLRVVDGRHDHVDILCPDEFGNPNAFYENNRHCTWKITLDSPSDSVRITGKQHLGVSVFHPHIISTRGF